MLLDGLIVMALGMGVVFTFLLTMVITMNISAAIFKHFPEEVPEEKHAKVVEQNDEIAVAIAAVKAFG